MIKCNISTGEFHDILVEAKGMGKNMGTTIWEPKEWQNWGYNGLKAPQQYPKSYLHHSGVGKNGFVPQRGADCNKMIIRHSKQDTRFYNGQCVNEVGLDETSSLGNFPLVQQQDAHDCGHCS